MVALCDPQPTAALRVKVVASHLLTHEHQMSVNDLNLTLVLVRVSLAVGEGKGEGWNLGWD